MPNPPSPRSRTLQTTKRALRGSSPRLLAAAAPLLLAASVVCAAAPGLAQSDKDKAASDKLYEEGLAKMLEGNFDVGCPKLAESQRLFPRPGTLFTLAECEAKAGRLATAMGLYQEYLKVFSEMDPDQQTKQREKQRDKISAAQAETLSRQAPRLTIAVAEAAKGVPVTLDGAPVEASRLGVEIPVDPGEHVVSWQPPGGEAVSQKVTLAKGEKKRVTVAAGAGSPDGPTGPSAPEGDAASGPGGRRIAAFVAGGVGVAGLLVGAITGGLAIGKKGTIEEHCTDTGSSDRWACDPEGKAAADSGQSLALVSSIGFGVGLAGVAAGVVLFLTAPSSPKPEAAKRWIKPDMAVGPSSGFIGVRGAF
jgi:hypothetical protein